MSSRQAVQKVDILRGGMGQKPEQERSGKDPLQHQAISEEAGRQTKRWTRSSEGKNKSIISPSGGCQRKVETGTDVYRQMGSGQNYIDPVNV